MGVVDADMIKKNCKRGWGSIAIDILESTLHAERKTRVMYKSNLNYVRFNSYFLDFVEKGLIEKVDDSNGRPLYLISEKGKVFLDSLKKIQDVAWSNNF
jgi:predicted transcriptional regulator